MEFDSEQLKLGIWSGELSLKDVNLKADAVYPHLNQYFTESEANSNEFTKSKPPARVKLVSGSIGDLQLNIPWQSLVWGQGDVKVDLRNVVVVLALESMEETEERLRQQAAASEDNSESSTRSMSESHDANHEDPGTKSRRRYQKQKIMREAERRQLQGRDIASWLERVYKKEEEERQREALRHGDTLVQKEGQFRSWLKGATKGFFWRFYAGLQMKIENLKVIIVQDSIEIGLIIPSIHVLAGKQENRRMSAVSNREGDEQAESQHLHQSRPLIISSKPPQNVMYESPDEDGEHVDKHMRILGLGIYVRKLSASTYRKIFGGEGAPVTKKLYGGEGVAADRFLGDSPAAGEHAMLQIADVSAKEYLLRPTELNVSYSLFYPYPPEKRKKKKQQQALDSSTTAETATSSVAPSVTTHSTGTSGKRRRGKRDKAGSVSTSEGGASHTTTPTADGTPTTGRSPSAEGDTFAVKQQKQEQPETPKPKPRMVMRRSSIGGRQPFPVQQSSSANAEPNREPIERMSSTTSIDQSTFDVSSTTPTIPTTPEHPGSQKPQLNEQSSGQLEQQVTKARFARRSSIAAPVKGSTAAAAVVSRVPKPDTVSRMKSVPLAQPDDITTGFSVAVRESTKDLTARLDGDVQFGPMQVVLSTRHFNLIDNFLSACARMRNGRPSKTVGSVLETKPVRHSVLVTSSELARATSVSTDAAATLRLGLNAPRSDRSKVVRSWWRYGLYAVRWEIQQRRKVRKHFQDKYLSFSWDQQRYRRKEYVTLYIASKLLSPEEEGALATDSAAIESLLTIEDELPVEQILLYRSLARMLHVGGKREMPDSIVGIRATSGYRGRAISDDMEHQSSHRSSNGYSSDEGFERNLGHNRTVLSLLEETCEISRLRMERGHADVVPAHRQQIKFSMHERKSKVDESTVGMTLDTRTDRRGGAGYSRATTRRSGPEVTGDTSMKFSFSGTMEKVELMVIEEDLQYENAGRPKNGDGESSADTNASVSDISELTEEDRLSDSATQVTGMEDESASDLIMASTDFLLFRQPEKHLLRTEIRSVNCTAFAKASGSRSFNFRIGTFQALSGTGVKLLDVGTYKEGFASDSALGSSHAQADSEDPQVPQTALSVSLVLQKDQRVAQCDIATVKATFDQDAITSLLSFGTSSRSPRPLMPSTPGENVRLYVVNQNVGTSFRFFDASFRLHGIEITIPKEPSNGGHFEGDIESTDEVEEGTETRAVFVADMIEVYSGQAANNLGIVKPHWQETYTSSKLSVLGENETKEQKTRHLRMLDVDNLISTKSAFLAFNVVSTFLKLPNSWSFATSKLGFFFRWLLFQDLTL